jgi:hypothetical protein
MTSGSHRAQPYPLTFGYLACGSSPPDLTCGSAHQTWYLGPVYQIYGSRTPDLWVPPRRPDLWVLPTRSDLWVPPRRPDWWVPPNRPDTWVRPRRPDWRVPPTRTWHLGPAHQATWLAVPATRPDTWASGACLLSAEPSRSRSSPTPSGRVVDGRQSASWWCWPEAEQGVARREKRLVRCWAAEIRPVGVGPRRS